MKLVVAVIKPFKLEPVRDALQEAGVEGMTVSEVRGFGRQKGQPVFYRGAEYSTTFVPKVRLEIAVSEEMLPRVVETITEVARTGSIGDGKIFVVDLEQALRIRTGEAGHDAL
jgi:nitrogen regulatory protein PII